MSSESAIDARIEAWAAFHTSPLYQLLIHSEMGETVIECVYTQGFNAGLKAALEFLSRPEFIAGERPS